MAFGLTVVVLGLLKSSCFFERFEMHVRYMCVCVGGDLFGKHLCFNPGTVKGGGPGPAPGRCLGGFTGFPAEMLCASALALGAARKQIMDWVISKVACFQHRPTLLIGEEGVRAGGAVNHSCPCPTDCSAVVLGRTGLWCCNSWSLCRAGASEGI